MSATDILIIVAILGFGLRGCFKGFIFEIIGILGVVLAVLCSFMLHATMLSFVQKLGVQSELGSFVAYFIGFIVVYLAIILFGHAVHKFLNLIHLGWLNRLGGFLVGAFKCAVILSFVLWIVVKVLDPTTPIVADINKSKTASTVMLVAPFTFDVINNITGLEKENPFN